MYLSTRIKAIIALIIIGMLGGLAPLFMKIALREFSSYQILFIRFGMAVLLISPLFVRHIKKISVKKTLLIMPAGLLFSFNVLLFIIGLQYTTSIVSQLLYFLTPVIVSLISYFFFKEKISLRRIISMMICFAGSTLLIMRSIQGGELEHSIGTIQGNVLILCAVFSWALYVVYTKHLSNSFSSSSFLVSNFITAFIVSCMGVFLTKTSMSLTLLKLVSADYSVIFSLFALAAINSVLFFFLYQWSLKRVSAFVVTSTTYISPLATALFAIPFFGEKLSGTLLISAASIFLGSYLILSEKK